jgi:PIN domain nuclease of toxin-antitoxin system
MKLIIDSSAIIAHARSEPGAEVIGELLTNNKCLMHAINHCEVLYILRREMGQRRAEATLNNIARMGVDVCEEMDQDLRQLAGSYKADYRRISLADCFGLALAHRFGGEFVTTDHHEIDPLVELGLCRVRFIR